MAKLDFGSKQARRLCQMSLRDRIAFIAEGLPIILKSAQGFWSAAEQLKERPREAEVLEGFAEEEAAKVLILIDAIRCPQKVASARLGPLLKYFYNHLARCLYAEAQNWKPMDVTQLKEYIDNERKAHYLEGYAGEYILPNSTTARRESILYADIEAYEDGKLVWNAPQGMDPEFSRYTLIPVALRIVNALEAVGAFTQKGLTAAAEVWGQLEFKDQQTYEDSTQLIEHLLERLIAQDLPLPHASQEHVTLLYQSWQMPMYNLDLRELDVPLDELHRQREAMFRAEFGDAPY